MPAPRRRLPRELFETRSHAWTSIGLGDELAPKVSRKAIGGLLAAVLVLAATLIVYYNRAKIAPGYGEWIRFGTVAVLVLVGSAAVHWLGRAFSPRLYRRLDPATAGTVGFIVRLLATVGVVILALRIAGVQASTLAVGGAFTAVVFGLAAQQALGGVFAGIVLQSTRPFRVGERVLPVLQREPVPGEVEPAPVVVEREQDDDEDRDEEVEQGQARPHSERPCAQTVAAHVAACVRLRVPSSRA